MVFAFESHFDLEESNAPLWIVAIPFAGMLLAINFSTLFDIRYEENYALYVFRGYDMFHKRAMAVWNSFITICYVMQLISALYFLEKNFTDHHEDKAIV